MCFKTVVFYFIEYNTSVVEKLIESYFFGPNMTQNIAEKYVLFTLHANKRNFLLTNAVYSFPRIENTPVYVSFVVIFGIPRSASAVSHTISFRLYRRAGLLAELRQIMENVIL